MRKLVLVFAILIMIFSGCAVKEGQLVVIKDDEQSEPKSSEKIMYEQYDVISQDIPVDKYAEAIRKISSQLIPLAVSPDCRFVFAYGYTANTEVEALNDKTIIGNMVQEIQLYAIDTEDKESKLLGKFLTPKDYKFDETGKLFAFIDGANNIYMYDMETGIFESLIQGEKNASYSSLSWSRDSKRLMIDTRMEFDISSKQFISNAVDSYTPFIKRRFSNNSYIVQMKNNEYYDMVALYDFNKKSFTYLASGYYLDSDNVNIIYTKEQMHNLNVVNLKTQESKSIDGGPIYCANIVKSTGEIIYTTMNPDLDSPNRYLMVKFNPATTKKDVIKVTSPTFYLSYAEDKLYFTGNKAANNFTVSIQDLSLNKATVEAEDADLFGIKTVLLKMFQLDYGSYSTYEIYEQAAKEVYTNTYSPVPQEALENKLIDFKRFNMALPSLQKDPMIPPRISFDSYTISGDRASINLGFYYINSIEMIKLNGNWYITGFSTHPQSDEIQEIRELAQKHINDIKAKNKAAATKYWSSANADSEFNKAQTKIVTDLISNSDKCTMEVGEIELWSMSDPHRSQSAQSSTEARVKVVIKQGNSVVKYKLILSRKQSNTFTVVSWNTDPLSISQLY